MPATRSSKRAVNSKEQPHNGEARYSKRARPAMCQLPVDSTVVDGNAPDPSETNATPLSEKAKGKQRMISSVPSTDPALAKIPSGPFLNPFNQSETRVTTLPRESMYYTTPRTLTLANAQGFLSQLEADVEDLVKAFVPRYRDRTESAHPLEIFVELWKETGWDVVHLTWGEDHTTREAFFTSTTSMFVRRIEALDQDDKVDVDAAMKGSAAIFALLLLYETQPRPVNPVPGLKKEAFKWAICEDDTDPLADNDIHKIKIPMSTYSSLLRWHSKSCLAPDVAQDVAFAIRSLCGLDAESSHPGSSAFHILPISGASQVQCEEVSLSDKTRGRFGSLVNQGTANRVELSRAEALLVRAAEALNVPLSQLVPEDMQIELVNRTDGDDEWIFEPGEQVTLFESKWIDKPLRPFDSRKLDKFMHVQTGGGHPDGGSPAKEDT